MNRSLKQVLRNIKELVNVIIPKYQGNDIKGTLLKRKTFYNSAYIPSICRTSVPTVLRVYFIQFIV